MQLVVAYGADRGIRPASADPETVTESGAMGSAALHAASAGSAVAVCGAPVRRLTDEAWSADAQPQCPLCVQVVKGFTVD
ncbi:MAG: hypothetical protein M3Q27_02360 [Actinomycetota bacterium]|nr:hypothetical protein [Actinomycetota bacterium]